MTKSYSGTQESQQFTQVLGLLRGRGGGGGGEEEDTSPLKRDTQVTQQSVKSH